MREDDKSEIFLARFNITVAPLQYSESRKISTIRRTITFRLRSLDPLESSHK